MGACKLFMRHQKLYISWLWLVSTLFGCVNLGGYVDSSADVATRKIILRTVPSIVSISGIFDVVLVPGNMLEATVNRAVYEEIDLDIRQGVLTLQPKNTQISTNGSLTLYLGVDSLTSLSLQTLGQVDSQVLWKQPKITLHLYGNSHGRIHLQSESLDLDITSPSSFIFDGSVQDLSLQVNDVARVDFSRMDIVNKTIKKTSYNHSLKF